MKHILILSFVLLALTSCRSANELAYIVDAERDSAQAIINNYVATIHPGDQLNIYIYSQTPESVVPFNQETHTMAAEMSKFISSNSGETQVGDVNHKLKTSEFYGYLVDEHGFITMPVLGKINAAGLTLDSLQNKIATMLKVGGYVNDAVVATSLSNFRVSVVGEVKRPRELHVVGTRLTIFEAIARCGDLTIDGRRDNIMVVRTNADSSILLNIDLTKKSLFESDAYYLQTNDIVYVEPSKKKKHVATSDEYWHQYVSIAFSVWHLIFRTIRRSQKL